MSKTLQPAIDGIPFVKSDGSLTQYGHTLISQNNTVTKTIDTELQETIETVSEIGTGLSRNYTFTDITLSTTGDVASWSSGFVTKTLNGVSTTNPILFGSVEWTGTDLFIYYDEDTGGFESTTDLVVAQGTNRRQVVATYKGGTQLIDGLYRPIIDGNRILTGQIGANQLIAGEVITSSAQIGNLVVDRINIKNGAVSDSAAFSVFPSGGFVMDQVSDNLLWQSNAVEETQIAGWNKMTFGNGLFVCVNGTNIIRTSSNGETWFNRTISTGNFTDVTFALGKFFAVGNKGIFSSDDTSIWTPVFTPTLAIPVYIKYSDGLIITTSDSFESSSDVSISSSPDGITWTEYIVPISTVLGVRGLYDGVVYGNGLYLVATYDEPGGFTSIMTSPDGITWTARNTTIQYLQSATYFNNLFIVSSFDIGASTSPDGITWTTQTVSSLGKLVIADNKVFICGGGLFGTDWSLNGTTWTNIPSVSIDVLAFGFGRYVGSTENSNTSSVSTDLITWNSFDILKATVDKNLSCSTSGSGIRVALGRDFCMRSADGVSWFKVTIPQGDYNDVIWSGTQFVAVGSGPGTFVATSPDGIIWTARTGSTFASSVAWNGSIFVSVTSRNLTDSVMTSPDGITWTNRTASANDAWSSVAWGAGLFVAVSTDGSVMTSPNGITWTNRTASALSAWKQIVWSGTQFVAVAESGATKVMTSPDGITWTNRTAPHNCILVEWNGSLFLAIEKFGKSMTSPDGITWTNRTLFPLTLANFENQLSWDGSHFIVSDGNNIVRSTDGINWSFIDSTYTNSYNSVCFGNGRFVAVSSDGTNRVITSEDGKSWIVRAASQANSWQSVTFGTNRFVAVSSDGTNRVMTSPDGITWTNRTASQANSWRSVCFGTPSNNPLFVAVSSDGTNRVMTSPDGITWTNRTASQANSWRSVCWTGTLFVAVSSDGTNRVMTSPDGITWTNRTAAAAVQWQSVTSDGTLTVAVANSGTVAQRIMTSSDGITWTSRTAPNTNNWTSITSGGGLFVAVSSDGTDKAMTSPDGINWTPKFVPGNNLWGAVTFGSGIFVTVTSNGNSTTGVAVIDTTQSGQFNAFFDTVKYDILTAAACPARIIIEPGLYGSSSTFLVNGPTVNGSFTARFITGFNLYKYPDHTYNGTPMLINSRGQKSLEYEWRNQTLTRSIGADQVESLVSPIILNKDVDYTEGEGLALELVYSSYSSNPSQCSIIRSTPGFGFTWSVFYK